MFVFSICTFIAIDCILGTVWTVNNYFIFALGMYNVKVLKKS